MNSILLVVSAALLTAFPSVAADVLPVCEKCLNPRILAKTGTGTAAASAEARVVEEDAAAWCATNRPRDPYCSREEVRNGGDGGRKSYKASANCTTGALQSIDGYEYQHAGVWPDGAGRGRAMLKDAGGNIPRWNSVVSGYGVARAEWPKFAGYSLTGQWEALCGTAAPASAQRKGPGATAPVVPTAAAKPSPASTAEWLASCFRCPAPTVISKSGIGTANAVAEARMSQTEVRESCSQTDPNDIAGCVRREMAEAGKKTYRAKADCVSGRITTIDDQQYTLAGVWDSTDIGGGRTKWRGADGQIVGRDNASGGLGVSQQWEVLCPGPVSPALITRAAAAPARPAAQAAAAVPAQTASVCAGKRFCDESTGFAAIIRDFRPSVLPDSTRIVSATVKFLNKSNRPLVLGYLRTAAVAIDERGNRYTLPSAESVRGIGEIGGRDFDPKFKVQPGQTADTRFEFVWRWNGRNIIGQKAWDIELAVREVNEVAPGQFRFGAEHVLQFRGVPGAAMVSESTAPAAVTPVVAEAAAPAADPAPAPQRPDACAGKRACFDSGAFVAEIQHATLTREGTYDDRVVRLNVMIRNMGQQPLSLGYVAKSSVLTDNMGNRFFWGTAGTYDMSATGIGKVEANKADPQFTLGPGESRMATFTLRRRTRKTDPDANGYTYNVTLAELQVINAQQVRTAREHSLTFADFALNSSAGAPAVAGAPASPAARPAQTTIRDLGSAIRGLGGKKR